MASTRRLAAIMFTDMVGSTALAQTDEVEALRLGEEQERLVRPLFVAHHGREIKSTGDGFLVEFSSALRAAQCAIEIQQRLHERNLRPGVVPLHVRVGVHVGDVEERDGDIFGDAVNIASRVEGIAEAGGVCLTAQVFDQVKNKIPYRIDRVGSRALKGIEEPIEIFRVVFLSEGAALAAGANLPLRLAVLPLANISPDPKDEYFAEGLTEELISVLSQIQGLRVTSRTSVSHFRNTAKTVSQIGSELGVGSVLEGSVRKAGDQLRITVQLIDVGTDEHRWAKVFDRKFDNVFTIQAEVAEETALALRLELMGTEREAIRRRPTESLSAYDFFLRGVAASRDLTREGTAEAIRSLEEAVRIDPKFGLACAYLANTLLAAVGDFRPGAEVFPRVRELVPMALALEPGLSDARTASGNLAMQGDQDWARAEADFKRAVELNPSSSTALGWYGILLATLLRLEEADAVFRRASELDPLWSALTRWRIRVRYQMGNYDAAINLAHDASRTFPAVQWPHTYLALIYLRSGQREKAENEAKLVTTTDGIMGNDAAYLMTRLGRTQEARATLDEWHRRAEKEHVSLPRMARLHAALGDRGAALELLERDFRFGDRTLWFVYRMEDFDSIRDDPRFLAMLRALRVPTSPPMRGR